LQAIIAGAKEQSKAEAESVEGGGPTVTEQDIAGIVAQWTGIPIEKVGRSRIQAVRESCDCQLAA
jgi:ATP-dependent Clp protease ATP-binding subunit ClpA